MNADPNVRFATGDARFFRLIEVDTIASPATLAPSVFDEQGGQR